MAPLDFDSRPPVVLLHSSGMSGRQWGRLAESLGPSYRVMAPDFLGAGENAPWAEDPSFDWRMDVDPIEGLIASLGEPAHLVGHSYGGLVALDLARRSPHLVRSLAVYDPVAFGVLHGADDREGLEDLMRLGNNPVFTDAARGGGDAWFEAFVDYWNGPGAWRGMTRSGRDSFLRVGRKVFHEVRSLSEDRTPASSYSHFEAPCLLLGGEGSTPAARRVMAHLGRALPNARVETISGAGHMGPLTHGTPVNQAILAHLANASRPVMS